MSTANITLPYKDPTGTEWTLEEIQALVNQTASMTKAADRLSLKSTNQLRAIGIVSTPQWVRNKAVGNPDWLPRLIVQQGSIKNAAEFLNVSAAHLGTVLTEIGWSTKLSLPDAGRAKALMQRFGSVLYVARMMETTPNLVKEVLPDWKTYRDPTKVGKTSIRTGRIGEMYYELVRKDQCLESPAMENHNNPGYDHIDREYGKVNTKAAPAENHKWTWDLDHTLDCDTYALVQLTMSRDPVGMIMVRKADVVSGDLPKGLVGTPRANTDIIAVTTRQIYVVRTPIHVGTEEATQSELADQPPSEVPGDEEE